MIMPCLAVFDAPPAAYLLTARRTTATRTSNLLLPKRRRRGKRLEFDGAIYRRANSAICCKTPSNR